MLLTHPQCVNDNTQYTLSQATTKRPHNVLLLCHCSIDRPTETDQHKRSCVHMRMFMPGKTCAHGTRGPGGTRDSGVCQMRVCSIHSTPQQITDGTHGTHKNNESRACGRCFSPQKPKQHTHAEICVMRQKLDATD